MKYDQWMSVATIEYSRILALLRELEDQEWNLPTDCAEWTVRDIVAHLAGAASATASVAEQLRQQRAGKAVQGEKERMEAVNAVQVSERSALSNAELVASLEANANRGLAARKKFPAVMRALKLPLPAPLGWASFDYLYGAIYTRDAWMHRIDISQATGRNPELTATHDGAIIRDLVLALPNGKNLSLELSGPAGGRFGAEAGRVIDAVLYARALAGRCTVPGVEPHTSLF